MNLRKTPSRNKRYSGDETSNDQVAHNMTEKKNDHKNRNKILKDIKTTPSHRYEFGGPIGAMGITFSLPIVIFGLYYICNKNVCLNHPFFFDWAVFYESLPSSLSSFVSMEAMIMFFGWILFHVLLERILPGEDIFGVILSDGNRLKYRMSGHLQFWITILVMGHSFPIYKEESMGSSIYSIQGFQSLRLDLIYDHYVQLIFISTMFSYLFSTYLYIRSFQSNVILAKGGNSGNMIYDFFIGRELNPRIGSFDLKEFCELRPGLVGWLVINLGMACKQYMNRKISNGQGSISMSMLLVTLFQGLYVWDALYAEKAILTTMDITTDGFGFMLAFGDLVWVPFTYSLQARYLVDHDPKLSLGQIAVITIIHFLGYYVFRSANSEKDAFRKDPNSDEVSHLTFLETKRGTKLLTSGWWGSARKINYTGDWLVTLSWCLLCGFHSPIPYFQAIYFLILLTHRAIRDDEMCAEKYGEDWKEYKRRVPYLFIPKVI